MSHITTIVEAAVDIMQQRPIWLCSVLLLNYQKPLEDIITQAERNQVQTVPSGFHVQTDSYLRVKYAKRGVRSAGGMLDLFSSGLKRCVTNIFSCGQSSCAPSCLYSFRLTRNSILILKSGWHLQCALRIPGHKNHVCIMVGRIVSWHTSYPLVSYHRVLRRSGIRETPKAILVQY
jgi:hypothetical protein